jgi:hypothetical protein
MRSRLEQYARAAALAEQIEPLVTNVYTALEFAGSLATNDAQRTACQLGELARTLVEQIEALAKAER